MQSFRDGVTFMNTFIVECDGTCTVLRRNVYFVSPTLNCQSAMMYIAPDIYDLFRHERLIKSLEGERRHKEWEKRRTSTVWQWLFAPLSSLISIVVDRQETALTVQGLPIRAFVAYYFPSLSWDSDQIIELDKNSLIADISLLNGAISAVAAFQHWNEQLTVFVGIDSPFDRRMSERPYYELAEERRSRTTLFNDFLSVNLPEFLSICHCEYLLPFVPAVLQEHLRISVIRYCVDRDGVLTAMGMTGNRYADRIVLVCNRKDAATANPLRVVRRPPFTFLKIHQRNLITRTRFAQLHRFASNTLISDNEESGDITAATVHSYVLIRSDEHISIADSNVYPLLTINKAINDMEIQHRVAYDLLLPTSIHSLSQCNVLLTVNDDDTAVHITRLDDVSQAISVDHVPQIVQDTTANAAAMVLIARKSEATSVFDLVSKLFSTAAHSHLSVVLMYLDFNDIIYGIHRVNSTLRHHALWKSNSFWRQKADEVWGADVLTRWQEDRMHVWADQFIRKQRVDHENDDAHQTQIPLQHAFWREWPLMHSVATYLQCRLNRFRQDIMHIPLEQLSPVSDTIFATPHGVCRRRLPLPRSLRDFLLLSPPFCPPPNYLYGKWQFFAKFDDLAYLDDYHQRAKTHPDIAWISMIDAEESSETIGLYLGPIYAIENEWNNRWGRAAGTFHENECQDEGERSLIGMNVREYYPVDADCLPVIRWRLNDDGDMCHIADSPEEYFHQHKHQIDKMIVRIQNIAKSTDDDDDDDDDNDANNNDDDDDDDDDDQNADIVVYNPGSKHTIYCRERLGIRICRLEDVLYSTFYNH